MQQCSMSGNWVWHWEMISCELVPEETLKMCHVACSSVVECLGYVREGRQAGTVCYVQSYTQQLLYVPLVRLARCDSRQGVI